MNLNRTWFNSYTCSNPPIISNHKPDPMLCCNQLKSFLLVNVYTVRPTRIDKVNTNACNTMWASYRVTIRSNYKYKLAKLSFNCYLIEIYQSFQVLLIQEVSRREIKFWIIKKEVIYSNRQVNLRMQLKDKYWLDNRFF